MLHCKYFLAYSQPASLSWLCMLSVLYFVSPKSPVITQITIIHKTLLQKSEYEYGLDHVGGGIRCCESNKSSKHYHGLGRIAISFVSGLTKIVGPEALEGRRTVSDNSPGGCRSPRSRKLTYQPRFLLNANKHEGTASLGLHKYLDKSRAVRC